MSILGADGQPIEVTAVEADPTDPAFVAVPYRMPNGTIIDALPRQIAGAEFGFIIVAVDSPDRGKTLSVHQLDASDIGVALATREDNGQQWPILMAAGPPNDADGRIKVIDPAQVIVGLCDSFRYWGLTLPDGFPGDPEISGRAQDKIHEWVEEAGDGGGDD